MNNTTVELNISCELPQTFVTFNDFFECYKHFFALNLAIACLEISLIGTVALTNLTVIIIIVRKKTVMSIFDKMLTCLLLAYLITSLVDFPFFHIEDLFTYWPFGKVPSLLWAAYDSNINSFVTCLMLYMTYARFKSVMMPLDYSKILILRYPYLVIATLWLSGAAVWIVSVVLFDTFDYSTHISYSPHICQLFINGLVWFLPLLGVYFLSIRIVLKLSEIAKRKSTINVHTKHSSSSKRRLVREAKSKFMIIVVAFLAQWTVPCIFMLAETFFPVRLDNLILAFKWTTYTVSLTDPILILAFCL